MNKQKSFIVVIASTLLIGLYSNNIVMAGTLGSDSGTSTQKGSTYPKYYPSKFQRKGVVSKVNAGARKVVIDGRQYSYKIDLQVHSPTQKYGSAYNLGIGQTLGFSYTEDKNRNRTVTEIWVINPDDYQGT